MTTRARVALIRTTPATVLQDYRRLMELADFQRHLDRSVPTILKESVARHFPFPSANTTPWQLEGVARALRAAGYDDLVRLPDEMPAPAAFRGEDLNGYRPILHACGVRAPGDRPPSGGPPTSFGPRGPCQAPDRTCYHGIQVPDYLFGKNIVYLPTLRCHSATTTTGAMLNATSALLGLPLAPARRHEVLVAALSIQQEILAGLFAVMDGTTAGVAAGPRALFPEVRNVILASADLVAIDAVAARLMGFDPLRDLDYVRLAHERRLGVGDVREIELVGDADLASERWHFGAGMAGVALRPGPLRPIEKLLARVSLTCGLLAGLERYHDYYRWPSKDRRLFESWLRGTRWGQLFQQYQKGWWREISPGMRPAGGER